MAIQYVGGQVSGRAGAASTTTVTYALTGGLASVPAADDFVVITAIVGSQARNPAQAITTPATWTALGQLNPNTQTYDTSLNVSHKFMPATPDTTVTMPSTGNVADAQCWAIQVFRGVDKTNPLDVAAVAASAVGSGRPNPGSITPSTAGAWVVICGGGAAATGAAYTAPANFTTNFLTGTTADTNDAMVGSGYWSGWTSGAVDPAQYTGGTANAVDSWAAYTLVLRPASSNKTVALTTALATASAGTLTASQQVTEALTGDQVTASAGTLTPTQLGAGGNVLQSVYEGSEDNGTSGTTLSATLSGVAAGSAIIAFVGNDNKGSATVSVSDGTSYTLSSDGACLDTNNNQISRAFYLLNAGSGSHTVTATFSPASSYRRLLLVEVGGLAASSAEDRAANQYQSAPGNATDGISSSATAATTNATDFVIGLTQNSGWSGAESTTLNAGTGYTLIGSRQMLTGEYKNVSATGAQTATFTDGTETFSRTTHVIAFKVATSGVNVTLTGAQVAASAGTLTASQQVTKALTGAQVAASAGTLSKLLSLPLTGAQVAASAGTITTSQAVTRVLTGAQVATSAGTLTASQQVTKALTGAQVAASAGTITPLANDITLPLTGAQVAASAGTLTASQQVTKALTGAQVSASAGTLTASQQVTKALTGAQVAASAGTLTASQQVTKALTGAQVSASAGTLTASQQVTKALTGAQVSASAGAITTSQAVTLALTGAQVAASGGIITPVAADITLPLTGAEVATSTGTITTSQAVTLALTGAQVVASAGIILTIQVAPLVVVRALTGARVTALAGRIGPQTSSQYPPPSNVKSGTKYGPTGVEFTGTMVSGGYDRGRVVNE